MANYAISRANSCIFHFLKKCFKNMDKNLCEEGYKFGNIEDMALKFCQIV